MMTFFVHILEGTKVSIYDITEATIPRTFEAIFIEFRSLFQLFDNGNAYFVHLAFSMWIVGLLNGNTEIIITVHNKNLQNILQYQLYENIENGVFERSIEIAETKRHMKIEWDMIVMT